jgi:hypothetical protein
MPGCSICNNPDGKIETDEHGSTRQCACSFRAHCQKRLPPDIAGAEPILTSPLLHIGAPGEVMVDLTNESLFIKSWWSDFAPHLLMALTYRMLQNLMFPFRITSDAELRDVYVGARAYSSRSRQRRDDIPTYNSLADFIGGDRELVVIRLGGLGYRNRAMPGILLEAMLARRMTSKATWIVEEPNSIFGEGHFSYSPEAAKEIREHYQVVDLTNPSDTRPIVPRGVQGAPLEEEEGISLDENPVPRKPCVMPEPAIQPTATSSINMDIVTGSNRSSRPRRGKGNFR